MRICGVWQNFLYLAPPPGAYSHNALPVLVGQGQPALQGFMLGQGGLGPIPNYVLVPSGQGDPAHGGPIGSQEQLGFPLANFVPIDFSQSSQVLTLPPCSPQKLLEARPPQVDLPLTPYPEPLRDRAALQNPSTEPESTGLDEEEVTMERIFQYVDGRIYPFQHRMDFLHHYLQEIQEALNNLREACATNENTVLEEFNVFWKAVEDAFTISSQNFASLSEDLKSFREAFNQLVNQHLPDHLKCI